MFTTKLLSAEVKNTQVILRIVLSILTKFLQESQIRRALLQEVENNPQNNSAIFHFCTQYFWYENVSETPAMPLSVRNSRFRKIINYLLSISLYFDCQSLTNSSVEHMGEI